MIPAAGGGARMRSRQPKQYLPLCGRTLLEWSLAAFLSSAWIEGVVIVLARDDRRFVRLPVSRHPKIVTAIGGAARSHSVLSGLQRVADCERGATTYALVHDAARPCVLAGDIRRLRDETTNRHGGLLAVPAIDTLKQSRKGKVGATLERSSIWRAQTPQLFRLDLLIQALQDCARRRIEVTDEASAMEHAGYRPRLVACRESNIKVTYPEDIKLAEFWLKQSGRA